MTATATRQPLLLLLPLLLASCGAEPLYEDEAAGVVRASIVGGRPATIEEVYSTVGLYEPGEQWTSCTATLVAPKAVITAAHCVVLDGVGGQLHEDDVQIVAGLLDASLPDERDLHDVRRIIVHPRYVHMEFLPSSSEPLDLHDIAVLILAEPIETLSRAPLLTLGEFDVRVEPGTLLTISGYGLEDPEAQFNYEVLNVAETPYQLRSDYELVAGGGGAPDTCTGDSGGPVYLPIDGEKALVGVTSYNLDESQICGGAGAYTLVPAYLDWIETQLAGEGVDLDIRGGSSASGGGSGAKERRDGCSCRVDGEMFHDNLILLLFLMLVASRRNRRC